MSSKWYDVATLPFNWDDPIEEGGLTDEEREKYALKLPNHKRPDVNMEVSDDLS